MSILRQSVTTCRPNACLEIIAPTQRKEIVNKVKHLGGNYAAGQENPNHLRRAVSRSKIAMGWSSTTRIRPHKAQSLSLISGLSPQAQSKPMSISTLFPTWLLETKQLVRPSLKHLSQFRRKEIGTIYPSWGPTISLAAFKTAPLVTTPVYKASPASSPWKANNASRSLKWRKTVSSQNFHLLLQLVTTMTNTRQGLIT